MKRSIILFLLCLTFIVIGLKPAFAVTNTFTEGIYKVSDFIPSKNNIYEFSNVSTTDNIYMIIMDENQTIRHSILLLPNSGKHITVPIQPTYRVILLGKGVMYFYPQEPEQ
jgi:hypothetical protein